MTSQTSPVQAMEIPSPMPDNNSMNTNQKDSVMEMIFGDINRTLVVGGIAYGYTIRNGVALTYRVPTSGHPVVIDAMRVPSFGHEAIVRASLESHDYCGCGTLGCDRRCFV